MTFNANIPQSTDLISQSQGQLLTNMAQLNTIFDVDHVTYNDATAANRGKHDKSTYIDLAADPATSPNEIALYAKDSGVQSEIYYRRENSGAVGQLTIFKAWGVFQGNPVVIQNSFNILSVVRNAASDYTITLTTAMADTNYALIVTESNSGPFVILNKAAGSFRLLGSADPTAVSFLVIKN